MCLLHEKVEWLALVTINTKISIALEISQPGSLVFFGSGALLSLLTGEFRSVTGMPNSYSRRTV